ncbi:MAG: hypothetical protein MI673_09375 [Thiotrichales bacterium]|nr:hypothetical protein [Thiotrichales bacterium]
MMETVTNYPLPPLRDDLQLLPGPESFDGSPTWNIYDATRNRYFRIGWLAFELLSRWKSGNAMGLLKEVSAATTCKIKSEDVDNLVRFLYANNLTRDPAENSSQKYLDQFLSRQRHWLLWILQNYLFIRIPLVRPDRFLKLTLPHVRFLFSHVTRKLILFAGVIGIYLVARQWDEFISTFQYLFNFEGLVGFISALVFIKIMHELGHAYVATRYGCRVSTMGIAFLVLFPVLYTDTTDAWRLCSRRKRLHIGAAGIATEVYIALLCTFLWALLPDGGWRSAAFMLATTSWLMSVAININIFLRFDGYYILSDWLGIENLQERSYALGKWKLRELLFGLGIAPPFQSPRSMMIRLVIYAWCSWLYRLVLFIGIALLVYFFFFKALGIILFVVEILWFILFPVARELRVWWQMKEKIIASGRTLVTLGMCLLLLTLFIYPWQSRIHIPAIIEAAEQSSIYAPTSGQVQKILVGEKSMVKKDQPLVMLSSPVLEDELKRTRMKIEITELHLKRQSSGGGELENLQVVVRQLEELNSQYSGLSERLNRI